MGPSGFFFLLPWVIVLAGGWLAWQLTRQNGRILLRLEALERKLAQSTLEAAAAAAPKATVQPVRTGLPVGSLAPDFRLADLAGGERALSQWRGRPVLLVFFDPRCGFCRQFAPSLAALNPNPVAGGPAPLVVSGSAAEENRELVEQHGLRCTVLLQQGSEVAGPYRAHGAPMGYLIDADGRIASELAVGAPALLALAGSNTQGVPEQSSGSQNGDGMHRSSPTAHKGNRPLQESRLNRSGLVAGTPAPGFRLPRVDGGELALEEYRGRRVLLVFSDPHCGPCDELAPRLQQAGSDTPETRIVMVSRGEVEANRVKAAQFGLTFPVVLQRQWEISKLYGMFGTPIAFLIDAEGKVAADVATGVEAILALLKRGGPADRDRTTRTPTVRAEAGVGA